MKNKKNTITLLDEFGNEHIFDVLFTFDSDETNKSYIVYTNHEKDKNGKEIVYSSIYDSKGDDKSLYPIETDEELKTIENILSSIEAKMNKEEESNEE